MGGLRSWGGGGKCGQPRVVGKNATAIAGDLRIDPMVVDVAVEALFPEAGGGKSDSIAAPCRLGERRDHDDVIAAAFAPAMTGNHPCHYQIDRTHERCRSATQAA